MDKTCLGVRRELTTDPKSRNPAILQHLTSCNSCADYSKEIKLIDDKISTALKLEVPEGLESRILLAQRMRSADSNKIHTLKPRTTTSNNFKWMSLAAGVVLAIGISIGMYKLGETHGLDHEILAHVNDEMYILEKDENIQLASLNALLKQYGIQANENIGHVRFAENCPFGDKVAPHFILDEQGKAVTVMYIPWKNVGKRVALGDNYFKGILFGSGQGSIAIISEDEKVLEGMEHRVMSSMTETRI